MRSRQRSRLASIWASITTISNTSTTFGNGRCCPAYPKTAVAGNLVGTGLAYTAASAIPGANALLGGGSGGTMLGRMALGAGSNALIGATDAYVRENNPLHGAVAGGAGGP